jgi:thiol-disulfide isomerase/thioredoxin
MRYPRALILCAVLCAVALPATSDSVSIRGLDGRPVQLLGPSARASAVFFIATDCPISNWYAPTIQQVCREYAARGVDCTLVYEDVDLGASPTPLDDSVRQHLEEYRYGATFPAAVDRTRTVAKRAEATITPSVVLVDRGGDIRYRGRIDNAYADLGKPRQKVTSHELRDALEAVTTGRPVATPETEAVGCYIVDPASISRK